MNGLPSKFLHRADQFTTGCFGKQVAMESLPRKGSCDCAIRRNQPEIETELLRDG